MRVAERACVFDPVEVLKLSEFELCRFVKAVALPRKRVPYRRPESERVFIHAIKCAVVQCAVCSPASS